MVRCCSVSNCTQKGKKGLAIKFHSLPTEDSELRDAWLIAIGRGINCESQYVFVCERHFLLSDYELGAQGNKVLKLGTVPSVFDFEKKVTRKRVLKKEETNEVGRFLDLNNSTLSVINQENKALINIIEDQNMNPQKPANFEQKITIQPFARIQLGGTDASQSTTSPTASGLEEPEIKIEHIDFASLTDPLLFTYAKAPEQSTKNAVVQQGTKKAVIKEIRMVSPNQAQMIKKLTFTPRTPSTPATTKSAVKVTPSTTNQMPSTPAPSIKVQLLTPATSTLAPNNIQIPNVATPTIMSSTQPLFKLQLLKPVTSMTDLQAVVSKPNVQEVSNAAPQPIVSAPEPLYKVQLVPTVLNSQVAAPKPILDVYNAPTQPMFKIQIPQLLPSPQVATPKPVTNTNKSKVAPTTSKSQVATPKPVSHANKSKVAPATSKSQVATPKLETYTYKSKVAPTTSKSQVAIPKPVTYPSKAKVAVPTTTKSQVATPKPLVTYTNKSKVAPTTSKSNSQVAASKPVIKNVDMVDLTLDDEEVEPAKASETPQNEIIVVQEKPDEKYKTNYICKICSKNKSIPYFRAPDNSKALNIWKFCIGDPSLKSSDVVCASHFIKEDYLEVPPDGNSLGKLKPHVVPTPAGNIRHGCVIPTCINRYKNSQNMYSIPVWTIYKPWIKPIQDHISYTKLSQLLHYRVCDRHFESVTEENMFHLRPTQNLSVEHELDEYMERRSKLQVLLGNQLGGVCTFLTCRKELHRESYKFPDDYKEAYYWLTLCNRGDILIKKEEEIKEYLKKSQGLCLEHYNQIKSKVSVVYRDSHQETAGPSYNQIPCDLDKDAQGEVRKQGNVVLNKITYVPMNTYCAFRNCASHIKSAEKKFKFPANKDLTKKWQRACGIADFVDMDDFYNLFVCGKHFTKDQFSDKGTLKKNSVPESFINYKDPSARRDNLHWHRKSTLTKRSYASKAMQQEFLKATQPQPVIQPSTSTDFINDVPTLPTPEKNRKVVTTSTKKCCVQHCKSDENTVVFQFVNLSRHVKELWMKAVENRANIPQEKYREYTDKYICLEHFEDQYRINDTELTENAIPTLGLVDDSVLKIDPDTSIEWKELEIDPEITERLSKNPVRSRVILRENSIEFSTMKRAIMFGEDCPKKGINKFPYNVFRMGNQKFKLQQENVKHSYALQMHSAIIVDDDDESEKKALEMMCKVLWENQPPQRRKRTFKNR